jgi:hypothetical protein
MENSISKQQYKAVFCKRVKVIDRAPVYINVRTHDILKRAVTNMGVFKLSISALVENIITEHLQKYESQINEIQQEEQERLYPSQEGI